jgi:putative ABC transport system ATP-binding protein
MLLISDTALSRYRNRMIGHIFQTFNLKPTYTAFENVRVPLLFSRMKRAEQEELIEEALRAVGLWHRRSFRPIELSEGQCQRVAIARAIVNKPRILLADEPTGNLDPNTARQIMDLLIRLNKEMRMTLVMVTHDLNVLKHADKVFVLSDGKLVKDGEKYGNVRSAGDVNDKIS